jgi:PspA/IM30 family/Helix-turn-helix domain
MTYQLRMHAEIRDWLRDLCAAEPGLARAVGEALLAVIQEGESLGPPLVVPLESVFREPDDPREALDYSYQRQLELLQRVRRGVADVATSRRRVELQVDQLEQSAARLSGQRQEALDAGHDDEATEALTREGQIQHQLNDLRVQLASLASEERKLSAASQRLQAKVDAFRTRKETIKATYTAAEASRRVRDAFESLGVDPGELDLTIAADVPSGPDRDAAAASEVPDGIAGLAGTSEDVAGPAEDGVPPPPGMMELRPGAPDDIRFCLLFVVDTPGTAVLVAWLDAQGHSPDNYQEALRAATARLAIAQPASSDVTAAPPVAFYAYDSETFLDEFFAGSETEIEIGAATLAARSRAYTLMQARERMRLTQAQVARRMNVREGRVSAMERAEPGETEVRTLAAYVRALGGTLEIVAAIGDERFRLR